MDATRLMEKWSPHGDKVPRSIVDNLKYRRTIYKAVAKDPELIGDLRQACANDILFWINVFGWTYNPKAHPYKKVPFVTYPFQDRMITQFCQGIAQDDSIHDEAQDIFVEKSRDMGLSWMCCLTFLWFWHFRELESFLVVSRNDDYVDNIENPKSLFWKLDFFLDNEPPWLRPRIDRKKNHLMNLETGSVINGEATTKDVGRGDRRSCILLDEFAAVEQQAKVLASTRDSTNVRIINSTPQGATNEHYRLSQSPYILKLRAHWTEHPKKSAGLYTSKNGILEILDKKYKFQTDGKEINYPFILDNQVRSPFYDAECRRAGSVKEIKQELDINYLGSGDQFFNDEAITNIIETFCKKPILVGELEYEAEIGEPLEFVEKPEGCLKIWRHPPHRGSLRNDFALGIDVSGGTGASNSVIAVWSKVTKEKVAEYTNPHMRPESLASVAIALAKWYGNSQLIWELNGPGRQFGDQVVNMRYQNIYMRQSEDTIKKAKRRSMIPGFAATGDNKLALLSAYRKGIDDQEVCNRSKDAMHECRFYIYTTDRKVEHSGAANADDPSGAKDNHGDRVIADALAWKLVYEPPAQRREEEEYKPAYGSSEWAARNELKEQELARRW